MRRRRSRAGRVVAIALVTLVVVLAAGSVVLKPWQPLRYGRVEPPAPNLEAAEPPVVRRLEALTQRVRDEPYASEAWGDLAAAYDVHDLYDAAIVCYERAQTLDPDDFRWPYGLGRCTLLADQRIALGHFARAVELRPEYAPGHVHLGRGLFFTEALDEAAAAYRVAADLDPGLLRAHLGLAQVALARDEPAAAIEHLNRALALHPAEGETNWMLSEAHRRLGDLPAAERHAAQAALADTFLEPMDDPERNALADEFGVSLRWRRRRASRYVRAGDLERAIAEWEAAAVDNPQSAEALVELGQLEMAANDIPGARSAMERALTLDPSLHKVRNVYGTLLLRLGEAEAGLAEVRRSCVAMPDNPDAHLNLALTLRAMRRDAEAVAAFERVLTLEPDHLRATFEYGLCLATIGRADEAIPVFREVLEREPRQRAAYINLVRALEDTDRPLEVFEILHAARRVFPDDAQFTSELAWRLAVSPIDSLRDGVEARRLAETLAQGTQYRDPWALDVLAAACAETGDYEAAARHAGLAVRLIAQTPPDRVPDIARQRAAMEARLRAYEAGRPHRGVRRF